MAEIEKPKRAPGSRKDRVRLVVLLYRKKGMSIEEFQTAWYVFFLHVSFCSEARIRMSHEVYADD